MDSKENEKYFGTNNGILQVKKNFLINEKWSNTEKID